MHSKNVLYDDSISMSLFDPILELLSSIVGIPVLSETIALSVLPSIFTLAFIVPRFRLIDLNSQVNFRIQWRTWLSSTPEIIKTKVFSIIIETIRELLLDCSALIS